MSEIKPNFDINDVLYVSPEVSRYIDLVNKYTEALALYHISLHTNEIDRQNVAARRIKRIMQKMQADIGI